MTLQRMFHKSALSRLLLCKCTPMLSIGLLLVCSNLLFLYYFATNYNNNNSHNYNKNNDYTNYHNTASGQLSNDVAFTSRTSRPRFRDLFFSHTGNIAHKWLNYFEVYDQHFGEFVGQSPTFLEIGVFNGGSLQLFQRYFRNARLFGVDVIPDVCNMPPLGPNITTFCFDINDKEHFKWYFGTEVVFDIIIDDGSHRNADIIGTFCNLFPRLRPGGVYLVEDTHTAYWRRFNGGFRKPDSAIQLFQNFVDFLHYFQINEGRFASSVDRLRFDHLRGMPFMRGLRHSEAYIVKWLHSVAFYDSVVVLRKLAAPKLEGFRENVVGKLDPAVPFIERAKQLKIFYNTSAYNRLVM